MQIVLNCIQLPLSAKIYFLSRIKKKKVNFILKSIFRVVKFIQKLNTIFHFQQNGFKIDTITNSLSI